MTRKDVVFLVSQHPFYFMYHFTLSLKDLS